MMIVLLNHMLSSSSVRPYHILLGSLILTCTRGIAFGPESDLESRRIALLKTHDHGLDLSRIACRTVELILTDILMVRSEVVSLHHLKLILNQKTECTRSRF